MDEKEQGYLIIIMDLQSTIDDLIQQIEKYKQAELNQNDEWCDDSIEIINLKAENEKLQHTLNKERGKVFDERGNCFTNDGYCDVETCKADTCLFQQDYNIKKQNTKLQKNINVAVEALENVSVADELQEAINISDKALSEISEV